MEVGERGEKKNKISIFEEKNILRIENIGESNRFSDGFDGLDVVKVDNVDEKEEGEGFDYFLYFENFVLKIIYVNNK